MRILVTGGTGYIGSRVVRKLSGPAHSIVLAVRDAAAKARVVEMGLSVETIVASLDDPKSVASVAESADAAIHLAFDHRTKDISAAVAKDDEVIQALIDAYAGTGKCFIATTATGMLGNTGSLPVDESYPGEPNVAVARRRNTEVLLNEGARRGVRTVSIRVPILTHDGKGKGVLPCVIDAARRSGISGFLGTGANRLPSVHVDDLADLYVRALDSAPGSIFNGVGSEVSVRALAETVGAALAVPVESISPERAAELWGPFYARLLGLDNRVSGQRARTQLGWSPYTVTPSLVQDIREMASVRAS